MSSKPKNLPTSEYTPTHYSPSANQIPPHRGKKGRGLGKQLGFAVLYEARLRQIMRREGNS